MRTGRGFERLVNFTDAVVAIAVTLLILPLVELPEQLADKPTLAEFFSRNQTQFLSFLISFLVIWNFWRAHHATIEYFKAYDDTIMTLHMIWLLTIVVLPFTTELLSAAYSSRAEPIYVGTLLVSAVCLVLMERHGRANPELLHENRPEVQKWRTGPLSYAVSVTLLVVLIINLIWPAVGAWPLLALVVTPRLEVAFYRRRHENTPVGRR